MGWLIELQGLTMMASTGTVFLNLVLGSCWLFMLMAEDITNDSANFNRDLNGNENRADWMKNMRNLVQLHSDAKQ